MSAFAGTMPPTFHSKRHAVLWTGTCIHVLPKEQINDLRDLYNSVGVVGSGAGYLLYRRRTDSHTIGGWSGTVRSPPVSRAQNHELRRQVLRVVVPPAGLPELSVLAERAIDDEPMQVNAMSNRSKSQ